VTDARFVTVEALLREERETELSRRAGQWSAFREQVQWRLDCEAGAVRSLAPEDRAARAWAVEVEAEVASMAPRFEGAFREELERRIFARGIEPGEPTWARWARACRAFFASGPTWAMAGGLAAIAIAVGLRVTEGEVTWAASEGTVVVDSLSFEGSAAVTVDGGVTVVTLASATE